MLILSPGRILAFVAAFTGTCSVMGCPALFVAVIWVASGAVILLTDATTALTGNDTGVSKLPTTRSARSALTAGAG